MKIYYFDHPIEDKERARILYRGDIIIYQNLEAMHRLIDFSHSLLQQWLAPYPPVTAQDYLSPETFLDASCAAQKEFRCSQTAKKLFFDVLTECGVDLTYTCYDHFPLRVVPFAKHYRGAHRAAIGHHRDTWGSNIQAQQNWWAPIYTLDKERTIALYPDYWQQALANTTNRWSFEEFLAQRERTQADRAVDYPSAPQAIEAVDESKAVKIVLKPGDVLNFSSAQLHASVRNTTDNTRYSVEMRTINTHDLDADLRYQNAAPNIDNAGEKPMYQWFKSIKKNAPLNTLLGDQLDKLK